MKGIIPRDRSIDRSIYRSANIALEKNHKLGEWRHGVRLTNVLVIDFKSNR